MRRSQKEKTGSADLLSDFLWDGLKESCFRIFESNSVGVWPIWVVVVGLVPSFLAFYWLLFDLFGFNDNEAGRY